MKKYLVYLFLAAMFISAAITSCGDDEKKVTEFTVNFNSNGGSAVNEQKVAGGGKVTKPADPTKEGYTFKAWYKESALNTEWNFNSDVVTANITLYAGWSQNSYTVTFNANGGTAVDNMTVAEGGTITEPVSTRENYRLEGWYREEALTNKWDFATYTVNSNLTLFAKWVRVYTVTFDSNGGIEVEPQSVDEGGKATQPTSPQKAGLVFAGWYKDNGTFEDEWDFNVNTVNADITLYANWDIPGDVNFKLMDDCESTAGWATNGAYRLSLDRDDMTQGTSSLKVEVDGSGDVIFQKTFGVYDTEVTQENGYLTFDFYISDISLMNPDAPHEFELTSGGVPDVEECAWKLSEMGALNNGWNQVVLNLAKATDVKLHAVSFIRFYHLGITGDMVFKIDNIRFYSVDTEPDTPIPGLVLDACDATAGWQSSYGISIDRFDKKEGVASLRTERAGTPVVFQKPFAQPFDTKVTKTNGYLAFDLYIQDISLVSTSDPHQIELSSSGGPDVNEIHWTLPKAGALKNGWNKIELNMANADDDNGVDLSAVNWFRFYHTTAPGSVVFKIDNIRFYSK